MTKAGRGRSIVLALAASVAILSSPGEAHAQRVAPAGIQAALLSSDRVAAAPRQDPHQGCIKGYIIRNGIAGGLLALLATGLPFLSHDFESPELRLLIVGFSAGIGAAYGAAVGEKECSRMPRRG